MKGPGEALHLRLEAEPASVGIARNAVAELGERFGMGGAALDDLRTIVSEATTNVVRHAYPSGNGAFEVDVVPRPAELMLVVRDFGQGLRAALPDSDSTMRLGLGLISMLSSHYEIRGHRDGGTELRISLALTA